MDAHNVDIEKYIAETETPSVVIHGYSSGSASGAVHFHKLASPVAQKRELITLDAQQQNITLTAQRPLVKLKHDEEQALWLALESSSKLIAKGRVV